MIIYPSIHDIEVIKTPGNWATKSGGNLDVLTRVGHDLVTKFFTYDPDELAKVPEDIRGLRLYRVSGIPEGTLGANEWHRVRNELFTVLKGRVIWTCQDTYGNIQEFDVTPNTTVFTPHHILHTYRATEGDTALMVVANTLFNPENPATHDSYKADDFQKLIDDLHI